jgi:protein gp37
MEVLQTKIQWTDFTINLWRGCFKVDADCLFCYMYRDMQRLGRDGKDIVAISMKTINKKVRAAKDLVIYRRAFKDPEPVKVFISSWTDALLDHPVAAAMRPHLWKIIRDNPDIIFQVLTKRPENFEAMAPEDWGDGWANVWLGTSVGAQDGATRIADLIKIPAKVRFLSLEPLHDLVNLSDFLVKPGPVLRNPIHWVIVGGESGNENGKYRYRECKLEWLAEITHKCVQNDVPVFVKQTGTFLSKKFGWKDRHGGDITEWPKWLQIRQMPA